MTVTIDGKVFHGVKEARLQRGEREIVRWQSRVRSGLPLLSVKTDQDDVEAGMVLYDEWVEKEF